MSYTHNPVTLLHIAPLLREHGISPVEIFMRTGISPAMLLEAHGWISRDVCFALGEQVGVVAGERFVGSKIGQRFRLTELGAWGRAIVEAQSLDQACALAASSIGLLQQGTDLRMLPFPSHAHLRFAFRGKIGANPLQHILGALAVLRNVALLAGMPEAVSVRLSMPYTRGADQLEESHGPALEFGCAHDAIVIDRAIMDQPLTGKNRLANSVEPADTAAAVGELVRQLLPYGHTTIDKVAARKRISIRTLQRRLRDWGFSFEEMVDDIRRLEAIRHVLAGDYSAMEIAFLLGYSDQAHFTRAFKRWTGLSPRGYANADR